MRKYEPNLFIDDDPFRDSSTARVDGQPHRDTLPKGKQRKKKLSHSALTTGCNSEDEGVLM